LEETAARLARTDTIFKEAAAIYDRLVQSQQEGQTELMKPTLIAAQGGDFHRYDQMNGGNPVSKQQWLDYLKQMHQQNREIGLSKGHIERGNEWLQQWMTIIDEGIHRVAMSNDRRQKQKELSDRLEKFKVLKAGRTNSEPTEVGKGAHINVVSFCL
jgi:hypothetical protein